MILFEDDDSLRSLITRMLVVEGYQVQEAANGKVGLVSYGHQHADLVITDILMPKKDGLETIRALLEYDPAVRILAISGGGRLSAGDCLDLAKQMGARRVLAP